MSQRPPFNMPLSSFWEDQASSPSMHLWLRVACLAMANHRRNRHTPFKPGGVRLALSTIDTATGELVQPAEATVTRAITKAVEYGWLDPHSTAACLVVPDRIHGGYLGAPNEKCRDRHREPQP